MQQNTADTVNDILRGVMEPAASAQALRSGQAVGRQDRHHQDNKAVWFDGYTPSSRRPR